MRIKELMTAAAMAVVMAAPAGMAWAEQAAPAANAATLPMTIDNLYRTQSLVGTTPEGFAWSPDGSVVAFLWNDEGYPFRDVWTYNAATGERTRLTNLGAPEATGAGVSQVVIRNDGTVLYVLRGELHQRAVSGETRRIESDKGAIRQLTLSPDGQSLAYVSGGAVDSRADRYLAGGGLWVRPLSATTDAASRHIVGYDDPEVYVQEFEFSRDGSHLAFVRADNRPLPMRDIHYDANGGQAQVSRVARAFPGEPTTLFTAGVAPVAGGEVRYFERPVENHHIWGFGLNSDGSKLFVNSSDQLADDHTIFMFDTATGAREVFYNEYDFGHTRPDWRAEWAPNDNGLILLTDREGYLHLYHQKAAGQAPVRLTEGQWEIEQFEVDHGNGQLYFTSNQSHLAERQIYRVPATGGTVERISPAPAGVHAPVFSPDYSRVASFFTDDYTPPELVVFDTRGGPQSQVTQSPQADFASFDWATIRYVTFDSHVDGAQLLGRLTLPADYDASRRYPLIVGSVYSDAVKNQWGGRRAHPTWGLDQRLADQGYIVMNVNIGGSWGQGREHTKRMHHSYGTMDIDDLESGVRHLVAEGMVDPARVGIWGSSYGGLMTLMSLSKKPDVYAVGIAGAPATNVWHAYPSQMWIMGPPEGDDMPARYEAQSALYQVQGIQDPVMIIHGSRDQVVLYADTIAVVEKLIAGEQPHELLTIPGGSHSWATDNLAQTRYAFRKMVDFFNRALRPDQTGVTQ